MPTIDNAQEYFYAQRERNKCEAKHHLKLTLTLIEICNANKQPLNIVDFHIKYGKMGYRFYHNIKLIIKLCCGQL